MYSKYCMQMKRPLIIVLLTIALIVCLSFIILHIAENKVISIYDNNITGTGHCDKVALSKVKIRKKIEFYHRVM